MLVLGANLTLDRTMRVPRLVPGSVQRPAVVVTAGGKSVNVVRAARAHGVHATLVANLPGTGGRHLHDLLLAEGHDVVPVPTTGEVRSAVVVLEDDGRATVLNEPGPHLAPADEAALLSALAGAAGGAGGHRVLVASGSLPPGADPGLYARVVALAHQHGMLAVLDAAGEALGHALDAGPDVVSPNLAEAEALLAGRRDETVEPEGDDVPDRARAAAQALHERGARAAVVSAGRHGLALADGEGTLIVAAPVVVEVNPIGAGDSLVAGLAAALEAGAGLREAVRVGVATAAASVASPLAGGVDPTVLASLRWLTDPATGATTARIAGSS